MKKSYSSRTSRRSHKNNLFSIAITILLIVLLFFTLKTLKDKKALELAAEARTQIDDKPKVPSSKPTVKNNMKYVVLDPGHGGFDEGASSSDGSLIEKEITLKLCNKIKAYLIKDNIGVHLTRNSDVAIGDATTEKQDLHNRSDLINSFEDASVLVSIHNNSNDISSCKGIFNYIGDTSNEYTYSDQQLSECILNSIGLTTDWSVNRTNSQQLYILNHATMPSVLVECGFLTNAADRKALSNATQTDELCKAIADGIKNYLNNEQ